MKIIKFSPSEGLLKVSVKSIEDLVVLSYVIEPGDKIVSQTKRKIEFGKEKEVKTVRLGIDVERVDLSGESLSVSGKIFESSDEDVPLHRYHTISIELDTIFTLQKESFLKYQIKAIKNSSIRSPKVFVCVYESGYAIFYSMTDYSIRKVREIRENVSGKRFKSSGSELFFDKLEKALLEETKKDWDLFIVAGVGIYNERIKDKIGIDSIIYETVSYADTGLKELMEKDVINNKLKERSMINQKKKMDEYIKSISSGDNRYVYGVEKIYDKLNHSVPPEEALVSKDFIGRNKDLISALDKASADIVIFNQQDESLYTLNSFGGIIVKFY
ncbi:MAG: hypothetical protein ACP5MT_00420 [Candidatus Acidifodinimicrobium sp.]